MANCTLFSSLLRMLVAVSALLFFPFDHAEASRYQRISYGSWKGGVYINDKTGRFSHCAVSADYKSGITLLFSVTRSYNWQVGFSKNSWNMNVGETYPVRYQVDRRSIFRGTARAVTKRLATIKLPATNRLFNQMRRGRVLKVETDDDLLKFNLTGTKRMLSKLLRCAKRNNRLVVNRSSTFGSGSGSGTGTGDNSNPFGSNNNTATRSQPRPQPKRRTKSAYVIPQEHRDEALNWYRNTLANSAAVGGVGYTLVKNAGRAQKMYTKHAIIWRVGKKTGIVGTLRIFSKSKPEKMENSVLANEARKCKGDFASKFLKDDIESSIKVSRLLTTCLQKNGKQWSVYYALSARPKGGTYLVTVLSSKATADAVLQSGDQISGSMQVVNSVASDSASEEDDLPMREDDEKVVTY